MKKYASVLVLFCVFQFVAVSQEKPVAKKIKIPETAIEFAAGYSFNSLNDSEKRGAPFAGISLSRKITTGLRLSLGLSVTEKGIKGASGTFLQPELALSLRNKFPFSIRGGVFIGTPIATDNEGKDDPVTIKSVDAGAFGGIAMLFGRAELFTDLYFGTVNVLGIEKNVAAVLRDLGIDSPEAKTFSIRIGARGLF